MMSGNLLIVDDEPQICSALTRLLRTDGYSISHALDAVEGMKLLNEQHFDVVVSDYMMPRVNGVDFLSEVSKAFPDTVRLMLSGQADMSAVIEAINSGSIFKFILKPWSSDGLRATIREAFEQSAEKTQQFDEESGWQTKPGFLEQDLSAATDAIVVVGEWINAATCFVDLDSTERQTVYRLFSERIEQALDITGNIGLVEQGTFACVAKDTQSDNQWQRLTRELNQQINISSASFRPSFRLGLSKLQGNDPKVPLRQALIAVSNAAPDRYQPYSRELGSQVHGRRTLESDLHSAIERAELFYELQPQVDVSTKRIVSAESLLRWRHPRLGLISPLNIVDMAEQSDLINEIGHWIARECCELLAGWSNAPQNKLRLAVNVSPRQFLAGDIILDLKKLTAEHKIDPARLQVEVNESCVMSSPDESADKLNALSEVGVHIVLDDFGTGHSTQATLSHLAIDALKIDRSFVAELRKPGDTSHALIKHVVGLGKSLNLQVITEGVETKEQATICTDLGCDLLQGYLFSKPLSVEDFAQLELGSR